MPSPLAHLRVVDATDLRGALAGRMLADLGADVVKLEPPGGDPDRMTPPFAGDVAAPDRSLPWLFRNLGKRGVVGGAERLAELCADADVLIENVGVDRRLRERFPHLVHVSIADFGDAGPRAGWRLEPLPAFASSGALVASGFADRPPCWLPGFQAHDAASVIATAGALAALLARARHGRGDRITVSVQEAAMTGFAPWAIVLSEYSRRFPVLPHVYERDADGPALVLPVEDGFVRLLAVTPRQLRALAALVLGREPEPRPEHVERPAADGHETLWSRFSSALAHEGMEVANFVMGALSRLPVHADILPAVHAALAAFRAVATRALAGRHRDEVAALGLRLGLPIVPVNRPEEFVAAEQTRVRGYFRHTDFPHLGDAPVAPFPCALAVTPATVGRPAPGAGEDTGGFAPRPADPIGNGPRTAPLAGVRVVSLGVGAVVPELCMALRDLGAEVVKIESAASPDFLRRLTVDLTSPNRSFMFNDENRGQRSVAIDVTTADGRELALRLCATADVVAENRQGGLVERLGLGYDDVRARRPDVVYVSSQGYGRTGPLGSAPAYGPLAAAFSGATWLWNHPDAPYPGGSSLEHPDHMAGRLLAVAVLAALEHRRRTGEGQRIDLAQSEATAFLLGDVYLQQACTGRAALQLGNASAWACPHGVYPSHGDDRWVAIAVVDDDAWARCREALGWPPERAYTTLAERLVARDTIDARVAAWTRTRTAEEAATLLQAAGVSACPAEGPEDHRVDAHLAARGSFVTLEDPEVGDVLHLATPLRFAETPLAPPRPAPRLGADTADVLAQWLGLAPEEVRRLEAAGVLR